MTNDALIDASDVQNLIPLSKQVDASRIEVAVVEAQRSYIRTLIGRALYRDLHVNRTDAKYQTLLNGGSYTPSGEKGEVDFYGLKPAIASYAYSILIHRNDIRVTRTGNKIKNSEVSEQATPEMIAREYQIALDSGANYMTEVLDYLNQNASTYPLFDEGYSLPQGTRITTITQGEYGRFADRRNYPKYPYYGHNR